MPITLDAISLPEDLEWVDEFTWNKVDQNVGFSTTGALLIQEGVKLAGRNITLVGAEDMAWITRAVALQLLAKQQTSGLEMTLTLYDTREFNVMFRQAETALDIVSVKGYDGLRDGEYFRINSIKFMEVPTS